MAEITAKQVQSLRSRTDLAMMDCKKALMEAAGDETKALEILRKKFADKMSDRAERETANGRIGVFASDRGAALAELRCETDFVATNEKFKTLADRIAQACVETGVTDVGALKSAKMSDGRTVQEMLVDAFGVMKENLSLHRLARIEGPAAGYVHHNGKVGAAVACSAAPGDAGRQICMHIASTMQIEGLRRQDVDDRLVAEARRQAAEQAKGKPEQIIAKIVEGKMDKWYAVHVLIEQPFVMDDKKTVGEHAGEHHFELTAFAKFEVGGLSPAEVAGPDRGAS
jgi:elongation factor Ts